MSKCKKWTVEFRNYLLIIQSRKRYRPQRTVAAPFALELAAAAVARDFFALCSAAHGHNSGAHHFQNAVGTQHLEQAVYFFLAAGNLDGQRIQRKITTRARNTLMISRMSERSLCFAEILIIARSRQIEAFL